MTVIGKIIWINGPVVKASGMAKSKMHELVYVGVEELIGEIIRIQGDMAYIQIYEDTSGLKPGEPVRGTGQPLSVTLGPGLIGSIFDGIQRPLNKISLTAGAFISRGVKVSPIPLDERWHFIPETRRDKVKPGDILGYVKENDVILHKIMVPPNVSGKLIDIVDEGKYKANETIAIIEKNSLKISLTMIQKWPVRIPRPFKNKLSPRIPLITGTRVIDTFFPVAKGGTACIPGGFGTGKTVLLHQISSWNNAKIVIYIGCGERGNEMSEILIRFPKIEDPYSGKPLMHRTIMIANTSNMPVVAREASIYTGVTLGEYYRDMGYDVVIVADSTSRWAEALREVSGRLEEMPAEEGYPSYLASRIAEFYERAGRVECLGKPDRIGSVTIIGAVSPPGGDFTEPVTTHTLRYTKVLWALDTSLAYARHYPAINWITSYSAYTDIIGDWWMKIDENWRQYRENAMKILQREDELREIVKILGPEILPPEERLILITARILREGLLQQDAFSEVDSYNCKEKQVALLRVMLRFHNEAEKALKRNISIEKISSMKLISELIRLKETYGNNQVKEILKWEEKIKSFFEKICEE